MLSITRRLEFDAGHRLLKHEGKCRNYHGHRYSVEATILTGNPLDETGMVVDFAVVKEKLGGWLDTFWDHGMLLQKGDPLLAFCESEALKYFELDRPPTAEVLAEELWRQTSLLFNTGDVHIRVYETPNCWADYDGE